MDVHYCYGCIHQIIPAEWSKCSRKYPGLTSCEGKRYNRRKDFVKWHEDNCIRARLMDSEKTQKKKPQVKK